jgi:hypothetical protein
MRGLGFTSTLEIVVKLKMMAAASPKCLCAALDQKKAAVK